MAKKTSKNPEGLAAEIGKRHSFTLPEREVMLNLARTFSVLSADFDRFFKEHGVTAAQYNALRILRGHGKPVSVYQIGEQMVTRQSDMPRLVDRLVGLGFAEKKQCEKDRRVMWVSLTSQGRALLKRIDAPLDQLHRDQLKHFTKQQLQQLNELLFLARNPAAK